MDPLQVEYLTVIHALLFLITAALTGQECDHHYHCRWLVLKSPIAILIPGE